MVVLGLLAVLVAPPAMAQPAACARLGWFPTTFGLKDHTIFLVAGTYYLASIWLAPGHNEEQFAYARSTDLCHWEDAGAHLGRARSQ